ncbi:MAG: oligosaccharide flippase family protein [Bacteroidales bacterium]|nr:oligosaccharide flippase family protein [Bacteroidales bacterium]
MNPLKRLAGQTAIYGLSSIIGRLLNYLLVPLYTRVLIPSEYGIYTEMFAWVSIIWVVLTYGMETTFFRFSETEKDGERVYSTSLISLFATSVLFLFLMLGFKGSIADGLGYADRTHYIVYFAFILSIDAITAIPFARLRQQNRPLRFAIIKLINIGINIGLNLFFILLCPYLLANYPDAQITKLIAGFFNPADLVGYIFISLLVSSIITLILLLPDLSLKQYIFDTKILKRMLAYTWPLMIVAIAGSINLSMDKILLKMLLPGNSEAEVMSQVGIYGACYKVSIIMTLFVQTFRYAADPFFFGEAKKSDSRQIYADVLKYFTIVSSILFLVTTLYLDVVIQFIGVNYRDGRNVVPILLMGNLFLGIFYNLSFWYKLTNRTIFGALFSVIGAAITIVLNIVLIPETGYYGSAWASFSAYFVMTVLSYYLGRKYFPVPYQLIKILFYLGLAVFVFFISINLGLDPGLLKYLVNTFLLLAYSTIVVIVEKQNFHAMIRKD